MRTPEIEAEPHVVLVPGGVGLVLEAPRFHHFEAGGQRSVGDPEQQCRVVFCKIGDGHVFDAVEGHLTGSKPCPGYTELEPRCGMNAAALRMMVTRLRRRYGELVRLEISHTLQSADDVEQELKDLLAALAG